MIVYGVGYTSCPNHYIVHRKLNLVQELDAKVFFFKKRIKWEVGLNGKSEGLKVG